MIGLYPLMEKLTISLNSILIEALSDEMRCVVSLSNVDFEIKTIYGEVQQKCPEQLCVASGYEPYAGPAWPYA